MDLLDSQPEFTKSFWDYLDLLVSDARIETGRAILAKHRAAFDAVEKAYGVDRHYVAAIWGVESNYSTADRRALGDPFDRDARLHRPAAGLISARNSSPRWKSSRAATCGQSISRAPGRAPSGRPSSCRPRSSATPSISTATAAATSSNSIPDLIASTANNLKKDGWVDRPDLGLRGRGAAGLQFHARRPLAQP